MTLLTIPGANRNPGGRGELLSLAETAHPWIRVAPPRSPPCDSVRARRWHLHTGGWPLGDSHPPTAAALHLGVGYSYPVQHPDPGHRGRPASA
jgi:hypothetical protein